jgi:hypothetical protein
MRTTIGTHGRDMTLFVQLMRERSRFSLTECINSMVLESEVPLKIVDLLFPVTSQDINVTVLWGS